MTVLTLPQKVFIVKTYYKNGESMKLVVDSLLTRWKIQILDQDDLNQLKNLILAFESSGTVTKKYYYHKTPQTVPLEVAAEEIVIQNVDPVPVPDPVPPEPVVTTVQVDPPAPSPSISSEISIVSARSLTQATVITKSPVTAAKRPRPSGTIATIAFKCAHCPKVFGSEEVRNDHQSVHKAMEKIMSDKFVCEMCGKQGMDQRAYNNHKLMHIGEKKYKCQYCPKTFLRSTGLQMHLRTHTGEKPYTCEFCGVSFATWMAHKLHVRLHTGERPHVCKHCGERFIGQSSLNVSEI